MVLNNF